MDIGQPSKCSRGPGWIAAVAVVAAAVFSGGRCQGTSERPAEAIRSIAVLPFENSTQTPDLDYLGDALAESLIDRLAGLPGLRVVSRGSSYSYPDPHATSRRIGEDLDVRALVRGRIQRRGDDVVVGVELVDTQLDRQLWSERFPLGPSDLMNVEQNIAQGVGERLGLELTVEQRQRLARRYTENPEAWQLYHKGRHHWNQQTPPDVLQALKYFEQAIGLDASYALAWAGVSDCYALGNGAYLGFPPSDARTRAKAAALEAIERDDSLAGPHTTLADSYLYWEWDWDAAGREFDRAVELGPSDATAQQWRAEYLWSMGRTDEAVAAATRAVELDPLSATVRLTLASAYYNARRHRDAIKTLQEIIAMEPGFVPAYWDLGRAYAAAGDEAKVVESWQAVARLLGLEEVAARIGEAYRNGGIDALNRYWLEQAPEELAPDSYGRAMIHAALGEVDQAFRMLDQAYANHEDGMVYVRVEPALDPLRADPRFDDLLRRMKMS